MGRTLSGKLRARSHDVVIGTRNVDDLLSRTEATMGGWVPPFIEWYRANDSVGLATFAEAAARAEIVINATAGAGTLDALNAAGEKNIAGKILVDVSNPLDFSHGMPPTLFVSNTESLAEQIQRTFPGTRVVKTLNTLTASLMVDPASLADGDHHVFVSGDDPRAKETVVSLLKDDLGWKEVIDLGDLSTARAAEMLLPMWLALMNILGTPTFNFKVVQ